MPSSQHTSPADDYVSKREDRAERRYLRLICEEDGQFMVQKKNLSWGDAHVITTDGSEAVDCSCPDRQTRGKHMNLPCYHMIAWENWTFDEVLFEDGTTNQITEREVQQ